MKRQYAVFTALVITAILMFLTIVSALIISFDASTPQNNSLTNINNIIISASIDEPVLNFTIFLLDSANNIINLSSTNETTLVANFTDLADGNYSFYANATSLNGTEISSETRTITIDTLPPNITALSITQAFQIT